MWVGGVLLREGISREQSRKAESLSKGPELGGNLTHGRSERRWELKKRDYE